MINKWLYICIKNERGGQCGFAFSFASPTFVYGPSGRSLLEELDKQSTVSKVLEQMVIHKPTESMPAHVHMVIKAK